MSGTFRKRKRVIAAAAAAVILLLDAMNSRTDEETDDDDDTEDDTAEDDASDQGFETSDTQKSVPDIIDSHQTTSTCDHEEDKTCETPDTAIEEAEQAVEAPVVVEETPAEVVSPVIVPPARKRRRKRRKRIAGVLVPNEGDEQRVKLPPKKRTVWSVERNAINGSEARELYLNLFADLSLSDPDMYRRCLHLNVHQYEELLNRVSPLIKKEDTVMRQSISVEAKLSIVLRHIATGEMQKTLASRFGISQNSLSSLMEPVCDAIYEVLREEFMTTPSTAQEWKAVADLFAERCDFPHCVGSLVARHVLVNQFDSKRFVKNDSVADHWCLSLLALVDASHRFIYVDVGKGNTCKVGDTDVWETSTLREDLESNALNLPSAECVPGTAISMPYVVAVDDTVPLSEVTMRAYSDAEVQGIVEKRVFNYRLSRARACSDNAFGVLSHRFLVYQAPMRYNVGKAKAVVLATIALHNWLVSSAVGRSMYTPPGTMDREDIEKGACMYGAWRFDQPALGLANLCPAPPDRYWNPAQDVRDQLCAHFNTEAGAVQWQERMVQAGAPIG